MVSPGYFRLFLASLVFLHHSSRLHLGTTAVYIFFILSGYWIYKMWQGQYRQCASPYPTFLISRVWRLLPIFIIHAILFIGLFQAFRPFPDLSGIGRLAHFLGSHIAILGYARLDQDLNLIIPAWSLDMELQFYILAPLIITILALRSRAARAGQIAIVLMSYVGLGVMMSRHVDAPPNITYYLMFFLIGVVAAERNWQPSRRLALISAGVCIIFIIGLAAVPETRGIFLRGLGLGGLVGGGGPGAGGLGFDVYLWHVLCSSIIACMAAPFAIATCNIRSSRLDRHAGNLSYVLYLNHWIGVFVLAHYFGDLTSLERLPYTLATWIAVFAATVMIYSAVDRPSESLRRRFVHSRMTKGE